MVQLSRAYIINERTIKGLSLFWTTRARADINREIKWVDMEINIFARTRHSKKRSDVRWKGWGKSEVHTQKESYYFYLDEELQSPIRGRGERGRISDKGKTAMGIRNGLGVANQEGVQGHWWQEAYTLSRWFAEPKLEDSWAPNQMLDLNSTPASSTTIIGSRPLLQLSALYGLTLPSLKDVFI